MESSSYFKSACSHCGGNIEAPAEGAGAWVHCPHCGVKTQLIAPPPKLPSETAATVTASQKRKTRSPLIIGLVFLLCVLIGLAGVALFVRYAKKQRPLVIAEPVTHPIAKRKSVEPKEESQPDLWNGLKPGLITIEKPSKGKLMYAVGTIRNDTDKQRFGVKVTLDILDDSGEKVGVATDYTQFIDAHKEWTFRALVTSLKAKNAKVTAISEN